MNQIKCTNCGTTYDFVQRSECPNCKPTTNLQETYKSLQRQDRYVFNQLEEQYER